MVVIELGITTPFTVGSLIVRKVAAKPGEIYRVVGYNAAGVLYVESPDGFIRYATADKYRHALPEWKLLDNIRFGMDIGRRALDELKAVAGAERVWKQNTCPKLPEGFVPGMLVSTTKAGEKVTARTIGFGMRRGLMVLEEEPGADPIYRGYEDIEVFVPKEIILSRMIEDLEALYDTNRVPNRFQIARITDNAFEAIKKAS